MRIATLNLNWGGSAQAPGCDDQPRHERLASCIERLDADLLVLTEFKQGQSGDEIERRLQKIGYSHLLAHPQKVSDLGVAIAARHALTRIEMPAGDPDQPWRVLRVRTAGIDVLGLYFPLNDAKALFWDWLLANVKQLQGKDVVLAGDFNTGLRHADEVGDSFECQEKMRALADFGFVDTWRAAYPRGRDYTWYSPQRNGFRLDYIWASSSLSGRVQRIQHDHEARLTGATDHSGVIMDLAGTVSHKVLGNIFRIGECQISEDRFTQAWAYALSRDSALAQAVANSLLAPVGRSSRVVAVHDHPECDSPKRPDLRIECEDLEILVEHKLDASLHDDQLESYLKIQGSKPTFVAFVAPAGHVVPDAVLEHPNYLRPTDRRHFRWSDFYPAVRSRPTWLSQELADHMHGLGMAPLNIRSWQDIFDSDTANPSDFGKVIVAAASRVFAGGPTGFSIRPTRTGRGCEVRSPHASVSLIYVCAVQRLPWPSDLSGPMLAVQVFERSPDGQRSIDAGLQTKPFRLFRHLLARPVPQGDGTCWVAYAVPLDDVLLEAKEEMVERVASLLKAVRLDFWGSAGE